MSFTALWVYRREWCSKCSSNGWTLWYLTAGLALDSKCTYIWQTVNSEAKQAYPYAATWLDAATLSLQSFGTQVHTSAPASAGASCTTDKTARGLYSNIMMICRTQAPADVATIVFASDFSTESTQSCVSSWVSVDTILLCSLRCTSTVTNPCNMTMTHMNAPDAGCQFYKHECRYIFATRCVFTFVYKSIIGRAGPNLPLQQTAVTRNSWPGS